MDVQLATELVSESVCSCLCVRVFLVQSLQRKDSLFQECIIETQPGATPAVPTGVPPELLVAGTSGPQRVHVVHPVAALHPQPPAHSRQWMCFTSTVPVWFCSFLVATNWVQENRQNIKSALPLSALLDTGPSCLTLSCDPCPWDVFRGCVFVLWWRHFMDNCDQVGFCAGHMLDTVSSTGGQG